MCSLRILFFVYLLQSTCLADKCKASFNKKMTQLTMTRTTDKGDSAIKTAVFKVGDPLPGRGFLTQVVYVGKPVKGGKVEKAGGVAKLTYKEKSSDSDKNWIEMSGLIFKKDCSDDNSATYLKPPGVKAHGEYENMMDDYTFDMIGDYYYDAEVEAAREERALRKLRRERNKIKHRKNRNYYN